MATFGRLALGIKLKNFLEQLKKLSLEVCGMLTKIVHNKETTWNYFGMIFEHTLPSEETLGNGNGCANREPHERRKHQRRVIRNRLRKFFLQVLANFLSAFLRRPPREGKTFLFYAFFRKKARKFHDEREAEREKKNLI